MDRDFPRKLTRFTNPVDDDDGGGGFESLAPVLGNSLIIRSAHTSGSPISTTSAVSLVRAEVDRLMAENHNLVAVMDLPFSSSKPSASCYLCVLDDPTDSDPTPRFDLLELWIEPMAWLQKSLDKTPCPTLEKVKAALTAKGMFIAESYSTATSGSCISLANHVHVDSLISEGSITFPAISPNPISVMRCRQIECLHAFEITTRDPVDNSSCLVDVRVPENETDCLVLLFAYNNEGLYRPIAVTETFKAGAESMNEGMKALQAEIAEIRRESRAQHEASQLSVNAHRTSVTTLFSHVEQIGNRLTNQTTALLAMSTENSMSMRSQLVQVQMMLAQHRATIKFGDAKDHEAARAEVVELKIQEVKLNRSLTVSASRAVALLGGSIGAVLPPPAVLSPPAVPPAGIR
ncbi:hypothetical protein GGX14DRAFT_561633 [Mycena pura]|uniref:Uncharacterized protein n=1 Tax=Mycena pura TaxID=153505 RepID=A0AAD6VM43_9AGAR|nr:hypothetical protein GGX14DRAFT_561633 [Mycena pura]